MSDGRVLVTGASGFVGSRVVERLLDDHKSVTVTTRSCVAVNRGDMRSVTIPGLDGTTDWREALADVQSVVHCAARVHVMRESSSDPQAEFRRVNSDGTIALARAAARVGVSRFVFVSSIKVNGESSVPGRPFVESDAPSPVDPYGMSKWEAEQGLRSISESTGLPLVIVRPPLVYGPGVRANFLRLARWVARGVPLPLGSVTENRRTFVALENLVDLLKLVLWHPEATGETFLAGDGEDLSTAELLRRTAAAMGRRARLLPIPVGVLESVADGLGIADMFARLTGTLQADTAKARNRLGWSPPLSVDEGLREAVASLRRW